MTRLAGLALVLAACGDNSAPATTCTATFTGNFSDATSGPSVCPTRSDTLEFLIDSHVLSAQAVISLDLGAAPSIGDYSSETIGAWHAVEAQSLGDGACVFSAGDEVVPRGNFTLTLTALTGATAHGELAITQYVHAVDGTPCGAADLEMLDVTF